MKVVKSSPLNDNDRKLLQDGKHKLCILHPNEVEHLEHIQRIEFGRLERVNIRNGLPVMIEEAISQVQYGGDGKNGS